MKWLYCIRNEISGKEYIGVTIDPERRWRQHKNLSKTHCKALKDAMVKYGVENFSFDILCCGEDKYIDELEIKAIRNFNTQTPNGYNLTLGGEGTLYYKWDDDWNNLLGTMTDRELSKRLQVPHCTIGERRRSFGIPTYTDRCKKIFEDNIHKLGILSDKEIANLSGMSASWVQQARLRRGKKVRERSIVRDITHEDEKYLRNKELSQPVVTKLTGLPSGTINKWRRDNNCRHEYSNKPKTETPSEELILDIQNNKLSYNDITSKYGLSRNFIYKWRKLLGINRTRVYDIPEEVDVLLENHIPIKDINKKYNIPEKHLYERREILGVGKKSTKIDLLLQEPYYSRIIRWDSVCKDLGEEWGIPPHQITYVKREYQKSNRRLHPKNLTKEEWLYIKFLYESGISYRAIIYNLGLEVKRHDSIQEGLSGKKYTDITGFTRIK